MTIRPHWSYSALTQYLRCPLQFYFQRVLGLKSAFTTSGLALGSAVHEALAAYHRSIQHNSPLPADRVQNAFTDAWKARRKNEQIQFSAGQIEDDVLDQGRALIQAYLRTEPPKNIVAVEEAVMVPVVNSAGHVLEKPLTAVIDLMTGDAGHLTITDLKTASKAYSAMEVQVSLQATCYLHAAHERLGEIPTFQYLVLVKTKRPSVQRFETSRSLADLGRLGDLVQTVDRAIAVGAFYPVESPLNCSSCSYWTACRGWRGQQSEPPSKRISLPTTNGAAA